jgi:hypothetical protein
VQQACVGNTYASPRPRNFAKHSVCQEPEPFVARHNTTPLSNDGIVLETEKRVATLTAIQKRQEIS